MTGGEKELFQFFQNYRYNKARLEEKLEQLQSMTYKTTPSYSSTGGGGSGPSSKVENYAEKTEKLKRAIRKYRRQIGAVDKALECPELSRMERRVLEALAVGMHLSSVAEAEGIYISRVYKIRDKALRRALRHLETRYEGITG